MKALTHKHPPAGRMVTADGYCEQIEPRFAPVHRPSPEPRRTDAEIRADIEAELQWEPSIDDRKIFVHVDRGIATLFGEVSSHVARYAVEEIAKRCAGVTAIANDIVVAASAPNPLSDTDIAAMLSRELKRHPLTRSTELKPVVTDGNVAFYGSVMWPLQLHVARSIAARTAGVKRVSSDVSVKIGVYVQRARRILRIMRRMLA